ncbi:hypothetical protein A6A29_27685 [Streptomyces sp. TSRI0281]|nr:hypothetical protein A6A29_27685 [Streptomyces sp. TSRI0281]
MAQASRHVRGSTEFEAARLILGFCLALAAGAEYQDREPDGNGLFYVGTDAGPVGGPGAALLGALMVQRLGRRPGDCAFRLLDPPEDSAPGVESAAA